VACFVLVEIKRKSALESKVTMLITCPHCHGKLDIDGKQFGERVYHARCNNWSLIGRHADGMRYGVKVQPPNMIPERKR
jgi:hypothetical protein